MTLEEYLDRNYSPTSVRGYANMIGRFRLALGEKADQASYTEVLGYIGTLRGQRLHPKTLRNNLFAVKIYFDYLLETGLRKDHPCRHLHLKDRIDRGIVLESLYDRERLKELYDGHRERDKVIVGLLVYQALTVSEVVGLQAGDVDLEQGKIRIRGNRSNRGRVLALGPEQVLPLYRYLSGRTDGYLFTGDKGRALWTGSINRIINRGRAKGDRLLASRIRQSVIHHLLKEGHDVRVVQEFAGHRRASSTEAYKQTGLEELKSAIDRLHPLG